MKKATTAKAPKLDKATKKAIIEKAVKKAVKSATKKAEAKKEKEVKAPKVKAEKVSAYEWATANIKKPNDAAARKLIVGDVIETFYNDDPKPRLEVVICSADKGETIFDVLTVPQEKWQAGRVTHLTKVNTDMWRLVGTMKFNVKK